MRLFEEMCKTIHKRAVTKMQTTAGRVIKGSWLSQQNLFRFMASSPVSCTCYATQQLAHQRPLPSEMPQTNVHARGRRGSRILEMSVVVATGCCCRALTAVHSWRRFNPQWSFHVRSMTHRAHMLTSRHMTLHFVFSNSNVSFKQEGNDDDLADG